MLQFDAAIIQKVAELEKNRLTPDARLFNNLILRAALLSQSIDSLAELQERLRATRDLRAALNYDNHSEHEKLLQQEEHIKNSIKLARAGTALNKARLDKVLHEVLGGGESGNDATSVAEKS